MLVYEYGKFIGICLLKVELNAKRKRVLKYQESQQNKTKIQFKHFHQRNHKLWNEMFHLHPALVWWPGEGVVVKKSIVRNINNCSIRLLLIWMLPYFRLKSLRPIVYAQTQTIRINQMFESWYLWFPLDCVAIALVWRTFTFNMPILSLYCIYSLSVRLCLRQQMTSFPLFVYQMNITLHLFNVHNVYVVLCTIDESLFNLKYFWECTQSQKHVQHTTFIYTHT